MVCAGCVFVAGIHPSRTWTSGSLESVRWNACVHRLDLGLYSSLCTNAVHRKDSKDPDVRVLDGRIPATKNTKHAPSTKMECDYLNGWIKKPSHTQKSDLKWWTPEILLENAEEEEFFIATFDRYHYNLTRLNPLLGGSPWDNHTGWLGVKH